MGAGRQRWWDRDAARMAYVFGAYAREQELIAQGFVPFVDRVHTRQHLEHAGVPILREINALQADNSGGEWRTYTSWVPAWVQQLMEPTFEAAGATWRKLLARWAHQDPEFRAAAIAVLDLGGKDALQAFVEARHDALITELSQVEARIDAAYWTFTRCKASRPPVLQVPDAYERRKALRDMLEAPALRVTAP